MILFETDKRNIFLTFLKCLSTSILAYIFAFGLPIYCTIKFGEDWKFVLIGITFFILDIYKCYIYTKAYLLKIELIDNTILKLSIVRNNGALETKLLNLQNTVKVELKFSYLSFNFTTEVLKINFSENGKTIFCQYPAGNWDHAGMHKVRKILKDNGIKVHN